ncbi:ribosomal protein L14-domain-containing protein [Syncephalastrum racemosum]|uniref:Ribosomal protein L14-domain-containing protein n=1 Tax=Syncephalastrum racemosum TaxID=13706 RepID=A0A1X2H7U3_SYNRA|nr:ribosomal protein L14-domain-containing protein [Syncephalastrum racemosum]
MVQGSFQRQVEVGRVVLLNEENKLAVIVDIVDHRRALIEGPTTGVPRQAFPYAHMTLTNLVIKGLPRNAGHAVVKKLFEKEDILAKWGKSAWAKKLETREKRANLTDFEKFKVQKLKAQRRYIARSALHAAKKQVAA